MKEIVTPTLSPPQEGSLTPGLEGAPCSRCHRDRMVSVISSPRPEAAGKEVSVSKG